MGFNPNFALSARVLNYWHLTRYITHVYRLLVVLYLVHGFYTVGFVPSHECMRCEFNPLPAITPDFILKFLLLHVTITCIALY